MFYQLNLREVTYALSEALDYVGIDDIKHGKRVAYIASEIAKKLGWRPSKIDTLIHAAMLHDCGVSSSTTHHNIVNNFDWENSHIHSLKGSNALKQIPFYQQFSPIIALHHTHWKELSTNASNEELHIMANLIYLSDRIDALRSQFGAHLWHEKEYIRTMIKKHATTFFEPNLCQAFIEISHNDTFWYTLESDPLHYYFTDWLEHGAIETVDFILLKNIALMFAKLVKSKEGHCVHASTSIASLARQLAKLCELSQRDQEEIELTALFHNLGALRIPDYLIRRSKGKLSELEKIRLSRKGFDTHIILRQIKGFERIASIYASYYQSINTQSITCKVCEETLGVNAALLVISHAYHTLISPNHRSHINTNTLTFILNKIGRSSHLEEYMIHRIHTYLQNFDQNVAVCNA